MEVKLKLETYRGKWYARGVDAFGEPIRTSLRLDETEPEEEALMELGVYRRKIIENGGKRLVAGEVVKFVQIHDLYLEKPDARKDWVTKLKPALNKWGRTPIAEIDEAGMMQWEAELLGKGLKPPTIKRYCNVFKSALRYGCRMLRLPVPDVPNIGSDGEPRVVTVPNDVRKQVFEAMPLDLKWYYIVLAFTGARPSELLRVRLKDVLMEDGLMWLTSYKGKDGVPRRRRVLFSTEVKNVLLDMIKWFGIRHRNEYVFKTIDGEAWVEKFVDPVNAVRTRMYKAAKRAGLEAGEKGGIFPYAFRHTFSTSVGSRKDMNPLLLSKHIGNKKVQTTADNYFHGSVTEADNMVKGLR